MKQASPNFILLVGEDVGLTLGCYNDADAKTPHLDQLAAQGCRYTNAFSTAPVCAPSRSTIVTGRYSWSLGTHHMRSTLLNPPRLFTHVLRDAGYYVNWQNKTDFNFEPPGPESDDPFADDTSDWLSDLQQGTLPDKPFFLYCNRNVTHESTMWSRPFTDGGEGASRVRKDLEHLLKPAHRHDPADMHVPAYLPDTLETRTCLARYYDALSIQDAQIGHMLEALEQSPYADNTIVIYLTDHGRGLAREKRWCYDAGIHLPLIVRDPRRTADHEPGTVCDDLVSWVDIAPTILSLAGVTIPRHYQGRAFLGDAKSQTPRTCIFAGRDRMDEAFDRVRVARDKRWHYIRNDFPNLPYAQRNRYMEHMDVTQVLREHHAQDKLNEAQQLWMQPIKPAEELYDAQNDPQMIHNLAHDPQHADTLARLRATLKATLEQFGDLGEEAERDLVTRGLVEDQLGAYRARIKPLPAKHRIGPAQTLLELHEARAYRPD